MTTRKSRGGPRPASATVATVLRRALGRRGFAESDIVLRWRGIVGEHLAARCVPDRLLFPQQRTSGAALHLRVASGAAPEIQHLAPLIIDKVNTYYGYRAVDRLHLMQGPLPKTGAPPPVPRRALQEVERAALDRAVAGARDPDLRGALRSLGESLLTRPPRRRQPGGGGQA